MHAILAALHPLRGLIGVSALHSCDAEALMEMSVLFIVRPPTSAVTMNVPDTAPLMVKLKLAG